MEQLNENQHEPGSMVFNSQIKNYLFEICKWAHFLAIVFFVGIALMVVFSISVAFGFFGIGDELGTIISTAFFGLFYALISLVYLYPTLRLYQFSRNAKKGLLEDDEPLVTTSIGQLKSVFKFYGVLTMIVLGIYAFVFLIGMLGLGMMK